jgi:predicted nucleic acid-binding protein
MNSMNASVWGRAFFDSNVLIESDDVGNPAKQQKALDLIAHHLRRRTEFLSLQVLQEYFVKATLKHQVNAAIAHERVEIFGAMNLGIPDKRNVLAAIDLQRFSFWDAMILRPVQQPGCNMLLSEDLQHGYIADGIAIVNLFLN